MLDVGSSSSSATNTGLCLSGGGKKSVGYISLKFPDIFTFLYIHDSSVWNKLARSESAQIVHIANGKWVYKQHSHQLWAYTAWEENYVIQGAVVKG